MADTEDYEEEATPTAHHETHEAGGDDEISLDALQVDAQYVEPDTTDFDGILTAADDTVQKALDTTDDHGHAQLHDQNTDAKLDDGIGHEFNAAQGEEVYFLRHVQNYDSYLQKGQPNEVTASDAKSAVDLKHAELHATEHVTGGDDVVANAVAAGNSGLMTGADKTKLDTQMGIHEALPTVHQDAPDLILTHKGDAHAHRAYGSYVARYYNTEYQAGEDGIVVAYLEAVADGDRGALDAKEGAVSGALVRRSLVSMQYDGALGILLGYMSVTFPVKKDNYWEVVLIDYGTSTTANVFWVPAQ